MVEGADQIIDKASRQLHSLAQEIGDPKKVTDQRLKEITSLLKGWAKELEASKGATVNRKVSSGVEAGLDKVLGAIDLLMKNEKRVKIPTAGIATAFFGSLRDFRTAVEKEKKRYRVTETEKPRSM